MRHSVALPILASALLVGVGGSASPPVSRLSAHSIDDTGLASPSGECSDTDSDGVCDSQDNCVDIPNPHQGPPLRLNGTLKLVQNIANYTRFSPDSSTVVFPAEEAPGVRELFSVPIDGGTPVKLNGPLGPDRDACCALISPDSTTIIFKADQDVDDYNDLYSVPIGGGPVTKLTSSVGEFGVSDYTISADSSTVVYKLVDFPVSYELYSVPIGGGISTKLNVPLDPGSRVEKFQLTSDGTTVVYNVSNSGIIAQLYSVPIVGGPSVALDDESTIYSINFGITPDGSTVIYHGEDGVSLLAVPVLGGSPTQLNAHPSREAA